MRRGVTGSGARILSGVGNGVCRGAHLAAIAAAAALTACVLWPAGALAAPNITGTWNCCGAGGAAVQTFYIKDASGSLSGHATANGATFASISGKVSGSQVKIVTTYTGSSYVATFSGTVSSAGTSMSGGWNSNAGQSGTWTATLAGPPRPGPKLPSFTSVVCQGASATSYTCTAVVGGATPDRGTPTGSVSFHASAGSVGPDCALAPVPGGSGIASCSVTYVTSTAIPEGSEPPVTADYAGGSVLDAKTGGGSVLEASFGAPSSGTTSVLDANIGGSPATVSSYEQGGTVPSVLESDVVNTNPFPVSADEQLTVPGNVNVANSNARRMGLVAAAVRSHVIATARHQLGPFAAIAAKVPLSRAGVRLLAKRKRLRVTLTIVTGSPGRPSVTVRRAFVLKVKR
jgi:hypothetical protein